MCPEGEKLYRQYQQKYLFAREQEDGESRTVAFNDALYLQRAANRHSATCPICLQEDEEESLWGSK